MTSAGSVPDGRFEISCKVNSRMICVDACRANIWFGRCIGDASVSRWTFDGFARPQQLEPPDPGLSVVALRFEARDVVLADCAAAARRIARRRSFALRRPVGTNAISSGKRDWSRRIATSWPRSTDSSCPS